MKPLLQVAQALINNQPVEAEYFEEVSIFFSDIVGFTALSSRTTPMEIVDFLNALYFLFDETIDRYDVYKVKVIYILHLVFLLFTVWQCLLQS